MKCNCEYEVGDVVGLKSGGPLMTVDGVRDGRVYCVYFDDEDIYLSADFLPECLRPLSE